MGLLISFDRYLDTAISVSMESNFRKTEGRKVPEPTVDDIYRGFRNVSSYEWTDEDYFWVNIFKGTDYSKGMIDYILEDKKNKGRERLEDRKYYEPKKHIPEYIIHRIVEYEGVEGYGSTEYKGDKLSNKKDDYEVKLYEDGKESKNFTEIEYIVLNVYKKSKELYRKQKDVEYLKEEVVGDLGKISDRYYGIDGDKEERESHLWESVRMEKGLYGFDKKNIRGRGLAFSIPIVAINLIIFILSLFGGVIEYYNLSMVMLGVIAYMLIVTLGNKKYNNKKSKIDNIVEEFKLVDALNPPQKYMDANEGIRYLDKRREDLVTKLNTLYELEDGLPIRYYQLLYVEDGKIRISNTVKKLKEGKDYKELVVPKLSDDKVDDFYNKLKEEYELDLDYKRYKNQEEGIEESKELTQKALGYLEEYQKLYESNKEEIGLNKLKGKWEDRELVTNEDKKLYLEENKKILEKVK